MRFAITDAAIGSPDFNDQPLALAAVFVEGGTVGVKARYFGGSCDARDKQTGT